MVVNRPRLFDAGGQLFPFNLKSAHGGISQFEI
jgi:hypothetical protein